MPADRKNCHTCRHLEWVDGEDEATSGYDCIKRHEVMYRADRESELLGNLDREAYRNQYKRCFESKGN